MLTAKLMQENQTEFVLAGINEALSNSGFNRRMVCEVSDGGKIAIWGRDGNTKNIDAVHKAGFPCVVSGAWRDPEPWAVKFGHTHWLKENEVLSVIPEPR